MTAPSFDRAALIRAAFAAQKNAYAPYSHFLVGAALLAQDGTVYTGCNVECATFSPTNCAERTALFKAVSEGARCFTAIAVVGNRENGTDVDTLTTPCGVCRQMLYEFAADDLIVIMARTETDYVETTLGQLLPAAFGPKKVL
jgi:cytidine deaminase